MNIYKRKINFKLIILMIILSVMFIGGASELSSFAFSYAAPIEIDEIEQSLIERQHELASSVGLSEEIISAADYRQDVATIYNYVVSVKFSGESTRMDSTWDYGKTYYEAFDEMYNSGRYSVNEYFKNMTNGKVNLVSVIINDRFPLSLSNTRRYFLAQSASNPGGYTPAQEPLRRWELVGAAVENVVSFLETSEYRDKADFDNNGEIDSISMIILPPADSSVPNPGWSDVLWPHKSSYPLYTFKNSLGQTIRSENYMLDYMKYGSGQSIDQYMQTPSMTTAAHELGHLAFNLPDLYVYDTDVPLDYPQPVYWWDSMGYNHLPRAQYMTSYLRLRAKWGQNQGFIEENQVVEIKTNGDYTLKPVNYEEVNGLPFSDDRTVAYKIVNPDDPTQAIYMEYRKQNEDFFDGYTYLNDGLLIYLVDEGFTNNRGTYPLGNAMGTPYNIFVYRGSINGSTGTTSLRYAPLNSDNQSVGEGAEYRIGYTRYQSPNLFWHSYSKPAMQGSVSSLSYVDSGIVIKFKEEDLENQTITFTIDWDRLKEQPRYIERAEMTDQNLYNALLGLAGKSLSEKIESDEFESLNYINLSSYNISSLSGFEKIHFNSNVVIDLSINNLTSLGSFESFFMTSSENMVLNLAFNNFTSESKMHQLSQNNKTIFAMQKPSFSVMGYSLYNSWQHLPNDSIYYFEDYSQFYTLQTNYQSGLSTGANILSMAGSFYFEFVGAYNPASGVSPSNFTIEVDVVDIVLNSNQEIEVYELFEIQNFFTLRNADWVSLSYQVLDYTEKEVDLDLLTSTIGLKQLKLVLEDLKVEIAFDIRVQDTTSPELTLISTGSIYLMRGSSLSLPLVKIVDNYDEGLAPLTDANIESLENGENQIEIYALDNSGNKSNAVIINVIIIEIDLHFDGQLNLDEDFDYLAAYTFSPAHHESQFVFNVENEINTKLKAVQTFVLSFTNKDNENEVFTVRGAVSVVDTVAPNIQFVSENDVYVFVNQQFILPEVQITDNYDSNLTAQVQGEVSTSTVGVKSLDIYAEDSSGNMSEILTVNIIVVDVLIVPESYVDFNEEIDFESMISIFPKEYADKFEIRVLNPPTTSVIGSFIFDIDVLHNQQEGMLRRLSSLVRVVDRVAPTIVFDGDREHSYVYVGSTFIEPNYTLDDNYNNPADLIVQRDGIVRTQDIGSYEIRYKITDTSGNSSQARYRVNVIPRPIENLEIIKISNLNVITPNTSMTFKVDTNKPEMQGRFGTVMFAWFVNGEVVETTKEEYFQFSFKEMGTYEIEVRAENLDLSGNKVFSSTAQKFTIVVSQGGILDKYSLVIIGIASSSLIGIFVISSIVRKRRKMFF